MYIALPIVFSSLMTIAGYATGSGIHNGIQQQGQTGAKAAQSTANSAQNAVISKGK